ncbi:CBS domain-containing protein [Phaeodactylibacter luteus]|nr:CBS domain-containing protein [Phaeodactylibacter luteus]
MIDLKIPVTRIMTSSPKTVKVDSPASELDTLFRENRIHHVPVVDEDGKVVGIVSKSDFLYLLRGYTHHESDRFREMAKLRAFKVLELMQTEVETLPDTATVQDAVRLLAQNRYQALPVTTSEQAIAGIVTTHDIIDLLNE